MKNEIIKGVILGLLLAVTLTGISIDIYNNSNGESFFSGFITFKYFTLQSNALVLLYCSLILFSGKSLKSFVAKVATGPLTAYILLTGLVYLIVLEPISDLYGLQRVSSSLLHYVSPVVMLIYWFLFEERRYRYGEFYKWLIYPVIFLMWGLFRAIVLSDYLYPFFDIEAIGGLVVPYIFAVASGFALMSLILIYINNRYVTT